MRATVLSCFVLFGLIVLEEAVALFPSTGFFPWDSPEQPDYHRFPQGQRSHFQGPPNAFAVLHTDDHRVDHGPDGEQIKTGSKSMLRHELKYRPDRRYGGNKDKGEWKLFGRELQYGEKEHSKMYNVPERPFRMEDRRFEHPADYHMNSRQPEWKWAIHNDNRNHIDNGYENFGGFPYNNGNNYIGDYHQPRSYHHDSYENRQKPTRYYRPRIPSRTPKIGRKFRPYKASYQSYVVRSPRKSVLYETLVPKSYGNELLPVHEVYDDGYYSTDWEDIEYDSWFVPVQSTQTYSKPVSPTYYYYSLDVNQSPSGIYRYHISNPNKFDYTLIDDDGWVEVEDLEPYIDQYKLINHGNREQFIY